MDYRTIIIDGPYAVRRPYCAVSQGKEGNGEDSDALYATADAFANTILTLKDQYKPERIYCAWEACGSVGQTFAWEQIAKAYENRKSIDPRYKANREPWPKELVDLVAELQEVISWMGVYNVHCDDEADDAIAALCRGSEENYLIWTADKDFLQLVSPTVNVIRDYHGSDKTPINLENIVERTGLSPQEWTAYLSLTGDKCDGVEGVPKIADGRARKIISAVPNILEATDEINPIIREAAISMAMSKDASIVRWVDWVFDHLAEFKLSLKLITLRHESQLYINEPKPNPEAAYHWFKDRRHGDIASRIEVIKDPWE